jgi:hypothetical protein
LVSYYDNFSPRILKLYLILTIIIEIVIPSLFMTQIR